jgi:hypothetical protein
MSLDGVQLLPRLSPIEIPVPSNTRIQLRSRGLEIGSSIGALVVRPTRRGRVCDWSGVMVNKIRTRTREAMSVLFIVPMPFWRESARTTESRALNCMSDRARNIEHFGVLDNIQVSVRL